MFKQLLRFAPSLVILLAAVIFYAGAARWLQAPVPHPQAPTQSMALPEPVMRPSMAECVALPHYNPAIAMPVSGKVVAIETDLLTVKTNEGLQRVDLTSATQIIAPGKPKVVKVRMADFDTFKVLARACNDGTQVFEAPDIYKEIHIQPAGLKKGAWVRVLLDETGGMDNPRAAFVMIMRQLQKAQ